MFFKFYFVDNFYIDILPKDLIDDIYYYKDINADYIEENPFSLRQDLRSRFKTKNDI